MTADRLLSAVQAPLILPRSAGTAQISASIGVAMFPRDAEDFERAGALRRPGHVPRQGPAAAAATLLSTRDCDARAARALSIWSASCAGHRARASWCCTTSRWSTLRSGAPGRLRGAGALAAPAARTADARRLHPCGRGDRADPRPRRLGAGRRLRAARRAGSATGWRRAAWRSTCRRCSSTTSGCRSRLADALRAHGLRPGELELELTESALMTDTDASQARSLARCARSACSWRSTTSAPATRRCRT